MVTGKASLTNGARVLPHSPDLSPYNNNNSMGKSPQKKHRKTKIVKANKDLRHSLKIDLNTHSKSMP